MASEDVIELGSSDDEAGPAPKKMKPMPNAMVHIPNKLPGVTIKPAKPKIVAAVPKGLAGKPITITKVIGNPCGQNRIKTNGRTPQKNVVWQNFKPPDKPIKIPISPIVNPVSLKMSNSQVMVHSLPAKCLKNPIRVQGPRPLSNLPPSITVKRTMIPPKRVGAACLVNYLKKKQKPVPKSAIGQVLTVELDDDEGPTPDSLGPQWYIRPEEQVNSQKLEEQNNLEPSKFIEITIEDSPVKPVQNKRTHEVGTELAITIDDSPVKTAAETDLPTSGSDNESTPTENVPHSKKKLEYPKEHGSNVGDTLEIEIEPMDVDTQKYVISENKSEKVDKINIVDDNVVIIEESPAKEEATSQTCTPKKKSPVRPHMKIKEFETAKQNDREEGGQRDRGGGTESGEFHPVYQSFIDLCFELENSEDMKKIVEKKIKAYYKQVPKDYTESEQFVDMVSGKILSMKAGPEKMYLYIKDIVDELNLQRKVAKSQVLNEEAKNKEADKFLYGEDSEFDSKRQRQIRKLEKTLKKLHRAVQKLEEQEVDFDDEEDSVYLLTESEDGSSSSKDIGRPLEKKHKVLLKRYKERMVRVHAKFCQLTNTKMPSEPRVQIDARPGQPSGPAKRLEKWINKKVPIGTPLPFPDFHDVIRCVKEANEEDKLGWNDADIMEEARDLFIRCGKKLQRRRQENEWRLAVSRITVDVDPAEHSEDLKKMLEQNKMLATKKETDVFNKYANKQSELKLVAEEIGDKEAEESPVESEDEDANEEGTSLKDKEKRKERLRRLLQEKSKKVGEGKENLPASEPEKSPNVQETIARDKNDDQDKVNDIENKATGSEKKEKDKETATDLLKSRDKNKVDSDKIQSLSDDSNKIESDIDELHLLQKLHSGNEVNSSTIDSSDSDTPIAISDTLDSSSDNKKAPSDDIISIENSSYSESEVNKEGDDSKECNETESLPVKKVAEKIIRSSSVEKIQNKSNNDEYKEAVEDILLASSDDENGADKNVGPDGDNICVNLKDDSISIGETTIEGADKQKDNINKEDKISDDINIFDGRDNTNTNDVTSVKSHIVIAKDDMVAETVSKENFDERSAVDDRVTETAEDSNSVKIMKTVQEETSKKTPEESVNCVLEDVLTTTAASVKGIEDDKQINHIDSTLDETVGSTTEASEAVTMSPLESNGLVLI